MKTEIKILSPLHIGSGEKIFGLEYFVTSIKKNDVKCYKFNIVNFDKIIDSLLNKIKTADLQKFKKIVIRYIHDNFDNTRFNGNLTNFIRTLISQGLLDDSLDNPLELTKFLKTTVKNSFVIQNNVKDIKTEIELYINNGNNEPYIPGSSIKGAIRTAILYHFLKEKRFNNKKISELTIQASSKKQNNKDAKIQLRKLNLIPDELNAKVNRMLQGLIVRDFYFNKNDLSFEIHRIKQINTHNNNERCLNASVFVGPGSKARGEIILKDEFKKQGFDEKTLLEILNEFGKTVLDFSKYGIKFDNSDNSAIIQLGKYGGYYTKSLGVLWFDKNNKVFPKMVCFVERNSEKIQPGWIKLTSEL